MWGRNLLFEAQVTSKHVKVVFSNTVILENKDGME
jgi:hypothetical protein